MTQPKEHLCQEHSGVLMWMRINAGLLTLALSLLAYSSFVQVPNLRYDIAKEMNRTSNETAEKIQALNDRVSWLEMKVGSGK